MVRRGWSAIPNPNLKGNGKGNQDHMGVPSRRSRHPRVRCALSRWSLEAIPMPIFEVWLELAALGPEDSSAKTELEGALKRARAQEGAPTRRIDPEA